MGGQTMTVEERRKTPPETDRLKMLIERLGRVIHDAQHLRTQLEARLRDPSSPLRCKNKK
jgi:hypothetical protein